MNFVVIEPHADDAFLSMGGHIKNWVKYGHNVEIITVYGNEKRIAEAKAYADYIGASHFSYGIPEAGDTQGEAATIEHGAIASDIDGIYVPLGLFHKEHREVRNWAEAHWGDTDSLLYYLDMPYAVAQKNREEVNQTLQGLTVESFLKPHASKFNPVKLFKTQSLFFHFNDPKTLAAKTFEMTFYDSRSST